MATYPQEIWPGDAGIELLDGSTDAATGLPYIAKGTGPGSIPTYEVQYNRRQQRENRILALARAGMVVDEGGLRLGVYPLRGTLGGGQIEFPGASGLSVPDNATRVVYLDTAGQLQVASAWPTDLCSYLPLAEVVSAAGGLSISDRRSLAVFQTPAPGRVLVATLASLGANQSSFKAFEVQADRSWSLERVQVFCTGAGTGTSVDVKKAGTSVLAAPGTPVAGDVISPSVADGSVPAGARLSVHVSTGASGSVSNLAVSLFVRG